MGQRKGYDFAAAVGLRPHQRGHDKLGQYRHDSFKIQGVRYGQMNVETEKNRDYHQLRDALSSRLRCIVPRSVPSTQATTQIAHYMVRWRIADNSTSKRCIFLP